MSEDIKGDPIPIRFDPPSEFMIEALARRTGFSKSEIIRRCVRIARIEMAERGPSIFYELPETPSQMPKRKPVNYAKRTKRRKKL